MGETVYLGQLVIWGPVDLSHVARARPCLSSVKVAQGSSSTGRYDLLGSAG